MQEDDSTRIDDWGPHHFGSAGVVVPTIPCGIMVGLQGDRPIRDRVVWESGREASTSGLA
jgi:hypothetical protein